MKNIQRRKRDRIHKITAAVSAALAMTAGALAFPADVSAAGGTVLPVEVFGKDVVSVGIPVVPEGEKSPFDFILDPQGLLYETDAMRYGGGTVEEGASLLFRSSGGGYDFSRYSDRLTVTNQSTVPVNVTISARVSNLDGIGIAGSDDFSGDETQSIYLAVADDEGNVQPISADGEVSFSWIMEAAPENAYVYTINEEGQTYDCALSGDPALIGFDTYSFGLLGACNPNADWKGISAHPVVTVVWRVDPLLPEQAEMLEEQPEEKTEEQDRKEDDPEQIPEDMKDGDQQADGSSAEKESDQKDGLSPDSDSTADGGNGWTADKTTDPGANGDAGEKQENDPGTGSAGNAGDKTGDPGTGPAGNAGDKTGDFGTEPAGNAGDKTGDPGTGSAGNTGDKADAGEREPSGNAGEGV